MTILSLNPFKIEFRVKTKLKYEFVRLFKK